MSEPIQAALAALQQKRDEIDAAIAALQVVIGHDDTSVEPVRETPTPERRKVSKPRQVVTRTRSTGGAQQAYEDAILKHLRRHGGVAMGKELRAAMPKVDGLDDEKRAKALQNALYRLKVKGEIARTGQTWSLVGIEAAA